MLHPYFLNATFTMHARIAALEETQKAKHTSTAQMAQIILSRRELHDADAQQHILSRFNLHGATYFFHSTTGTEHFFTQLHGTDSIDDPLEELAAMHQAMMWSCDIMRQTSTYVAVCSYSP